MKSLISEMNKFGRASSWEIKHCVSEEEYIAVRNQKGKLKNYFNRTTTGAMEFAERKTLEESF